MHTEQTTSLQPWKARSPSAAFSGKDSPFGMFDASANARDWLCIAWSPCLEELLFTAPYDAQDRRESLDAGPDIAGCMCGGVFLRAPNSVANKVRDAIEPDIRDDSGSFRVVNTNSAYAQKQSSEGART